MGVFVIGCLHLGHESMAKHRGFSSSQEHDEYLVKQWNKVVSKRDKVFILGDVTMEKEAPYELLKRLNGYKHVILGNHDLPQDVPKLLNYVGKVSGPFHYKGVWLTHIPIHPVEFAYGIKLNIHAHIHEVELNDNRYLNVDAKRLNYTPLKWV